MLIQLDNIVLDVFSCQFVIYSIAYFVLPTSIYYASITQDVFSCVKPYPPFNNTQ